MDTTKLRCDCGTSLLVKRSAIGRSVHCPRCGQAWGVTAADFGDRAASATGAAAAARSSKSRRDVVMAVTLAGLVVMAGGLWGLTRGHTRGHEDPTLPTTVGHVERPLAAPISQGEEPANKPAAPAGDGGSHEFALFDGLGSDKAPQKVEAPGPPSVADTAGVAETTEREVASTGTESEGTTKEQIKEPEVKQDGFDPGKPLPSKKVTESPTKPASDQNDSGVRGPSRRDLGGAGRPGRGDRGGGRGGRGGGR